MKKLFWKYFIYVFSVALITILIHSSVLIIQYGISQDSWKDSVYEDFVEGVQRHLTKESFLNQGRVNLVSLVSDSWDERISGCVVSDTDGNTVLTYGKTPKGLQLAGMFPENQRFSEERNYKTISRDDIKTSVIEIKFNDEQLIPDIEVEKAAVKKSDVNDLKVPALMDKDDIIGSVTVKLNDEELFTVHLLAHSLRTYVNTREFVNSSLRSMMYAALTSMIVAFCAAWFASANETKYIDGIRKALNDLANNRSNVKIRRRKNPQLNEIANAIEELDKNLQANSKSRNAWLNSISHDLNTPASSMKIIIDGMADGVFPADSQSLEALRKENDDLLGRIERVIEFSRLQADVTPEFTDISFKNIIHCKDDVHVENSEKIIRCDDLLLSRAVDEVTDNAVKYGEGDVSVSVSEDDNCYYISVVNKGILPACFKAEDLLEPWLRGDSSRTEGGNGLGLPIAGKIMELHNGKLTIESCDGMVTACLSWPKGLKNRLSETSEPESVENN